MSTIFSDIVKSGVWIGELLSKIILKRRKTWPIEIKVYGEVTTSIGPQRGVISPHHMGHVDLQFVIKLNHVPVYIQSIFLKYNGDWFSGSELNKQEEIM